MTIVEDKQSLPQDMEALKYIAVVGVILALIGECNGQPGAEVPLSSWKVNILNEMTKDSLFIRCKSKDDDLGAQNLGVKQQFSWSFKENLWQTTLYWCYMHNAKSHASFNVYWPERSGWLAFRCQLRNCIWSARDDGIYLKTNTHNTYELIHTWEPGM